MTASDPTPPQALAPADAEALARRVAELEEANHRLRSILRQAGDIIVITDLSGRITEFNEAAEQLLGYAADEVLGQPAELFYVQRGLRQRLLQQLADEPDAVVRADFMVRTKAGKKRWVGLSLSWLRDAAGNRVGTIGVSKDVTARRELEEKLRQLSITDKLTGLYNQSHFFAKLEIEKERSLRLNHGLSLVLFDLDGFKQLNDTRGHREGDAVLRRVGRVLFENIRKEVDSAFRYGGDEFTVLLPGTDTDAAVRFAERVRRQVVELETGVRASLGVCPFDRHNRALQIVEKADEAMYLAKRAGGDRVAYYDLLQKQPLLWDGPGE